MKLTAKQHRNIANGIERINKSAFIASLHTLKWNWPCNSIDIKTGTYFSDRFKK